MQTAEQIAREIMAKKTRKGSTFNRHTTDELRDWGAGDEPYSSRSAAPAETPAAFWASVRRIPVVRESNIDARVFNQETHW